MASDEEVVLSEDGNLCSELSKAQRDISKRLLDIYDDLWDNEQLLDKVYIGGSLDSLKAWENTISNPTYVVPRRRKSTIHDESAADESGIEEEDKFKRNYELEFVNCDAWKIGVEPFTYRYMGNNGRYRAYKLARKLMNNSKMKGNQQQIGKLNPDKRLLQREIQRELRKEFEVFVKTEREVSALFRQQELAAANIKHKKKRMDKPERTLEKVEDLLDSVHKHKTNDTEGQVEKLDNKNVSATDENLTPRSTLSILSSQTPLPPITIPLLSSEKSEPREPQAKLLSRSMDDLSSLKTETMKKDQKLWHVPLSMGGEQNEHVELQRNGPKRFEWSAQTVIHPSLSEPPSRTSPRVPRSNKSAPAVKPDGSAYRLKKLPTISDFNDNEAVESSHEYFGQKEVLLGQGYNAKEGDKGVAAPRKASRRREEIISKQQYQDDTMSLTSEPVLQGTAYDIGKLRASANQFQQMYPDPVSLIGDLRAVYRENQGYSVSSEQGDAIPSTEDFQRYPNGMQDISVFGKPKSQRVKGDTFQAQDLTNIITTKQYVNTKSRTGLNPYLRKPKPGSNVVHQQLFTMEGVQPEIGETLGTFPINEPTPGLSNHVQRGDVMPDMMVQRAEIALSSKRVI